jgi:hypothetical protein
MLPKRTAAATVDSAHKCPAFPSIFPSLPTVCTHQQATHSSKAQGASEARTELYLTYSEGVLELATQRFAESISGATSIAGWQAGAVCGLLGIQSFLQFSNMLLYLTLKGHFFFNFFYRVNGGCMVFTSKLMGNFRKA